MSEPLVLGGNFANDAAGAARGDDALGDIVRHHAPRADDAVVADRHALQDLDIRGDPDTIADLYGLVYHFVFGIIYYGNFFTFKFPSLSLASAFMSFNTKSSARTNLPTLKIASPFAIFKYS